MVPIFAVLESHFHREPGVCVQLAPVKSGLKGCELYTNPGEEGVSTKFSKDGFEGKVLGSLELCKAPTPRGTTRPASKKERFA